MIFQWQIFEYRKYQPPGPAQGISVFFPVYQYFKHVGTSLVAVESGILDMCISSNINI